MTHYRIIRTLALALNMFLVASVIGGAIILPQQLLRGQVLTRGVIRILAAGTAVMAIRWPNGLTRRPN
jgi:hypothetical protein